MTETSAHGGCVVRPRSPAKVNLMLSVHGRRADGYHDLTSVVVATGLEDVLTVRALPAGAGADRLECADAGVPAGADNLVLRAAAVFRRRMGRTVWHGFEMEKRIPSGAGLGGGSANAGAALRGMNALAGAPFGPEDLRAMAAELGSDCPFFIDPRPSVLRGRGERIEPLPAEAAARLAGRRLLLFRPPFGVSTARAYADLAAAGAYEGADVAERRLARFLRGGGPEVLLHNDFEVTVGARHPAIPLLLEGLRERGLPCRMSGSGSACFALPPDDPAVGAAAVAWLREVLGPDVFCVETSIAG